MQMLKDKQFQVRNAALIILTDWKDKDALPQIKQIITGDQTPDRQGANAAIVPTIRPIINQSLDREVIATYLTIDDSDGARDFILGLLDNNSDERNITVLRAVVSADIPSERKLAMFLAARPKLKYPYMLPTIIQFEKNETKTCAICLFP